MTSLLRNTYHSRSWPQRPPILHWRFQSSPLKICITTSDPMPQASIRSSLHLLATLLNSLHCLQSAFSLSLDHNSSVMGLRALRANTLCTPPGPSIRTSSHLSSSSTPCIVGKVCSSRRNAYDSSGPFLWRSSFGSGSLSTLRRL